MIKAVVDTRGLKRFKKSGASPDAYNANDLNGASLTLDAGNAKDLFRKMTTTTNYAGNFGDRPKQDQDHMILQ